jgi:hypothetical protein
MAGPARWLDKLGLNNLHCGFIAGENGEELDKAPTAYGNGLQRCISADTTWSQVQVLNNLHRGFTAGTLFRCAWHWLLSSSYHHCLTVGFGHTFTKFALMEGGTSNCNFEIFSCIDCQCQYVTSKCTLRLCFEVINYIWFWLCRASLLYLVFP